MNGSVSIKSLFALAILTAAGVAAYQIANEQGLLQSNGGDETAVTPDDIDRQFNPNRMYEGSGRNDVRDGYEMKAQDRPQGAPGVGRPEAGAGNRDTTPSSAAANLAQLQYEAQYRYRMYLNAVQTLPPNHPAIGAAYSDYVRANQAFENARRRVGG